MNNENSKYALITGASEGMGRAMAEELARRGMNLALIALPKSGLADTAKELSENYNITAEYYECDLTDEKEPEKILKWTRKKGLAINMLINNAGFGYPGLFEDSEIQINEKMMHLNMLAVMRLCHLFLADLREQGQKEKAYLMNVASVAAFYPFPYKPIYASSKAFVYSFTIALREELKRHNISVSVLCPGGVMTNESCRQRIEIQGFFGKISSLTPKQAAGYAIKRFLRGKAIIVPGFTNKLYRIMGKTFPVLLLQKILLKRFRRDEEAMAKLCEPEDQDQA